MSRLPVMTLLAAVTLIGGCAQQPVAPDSSSDGPSLAFLAGGGENLVVAGTGLHVQPASFDANIPAASAGDILSATLYWSGRGETDTGDDTILINGTEYVGTLIDKWELPFGVPWVFFYQLDASALVAPGPNSFIIDGFTLDSPRTDGIGLAVVFADAGSPWESVTIFEPSEFIYWGFEPEGLEKTAVNGVVFPASGEERTAKLSIFVTDCEDTRSDEIWWSATAGPVPADLEHAANVLLDQFYSNAGDEIDIYENDTFVIPADAEHFAYQLVSPRAGDGDSMAHIFAAMCITGPTNEDPGGCRVTGGGVDTNGGWDGSFAKGKSGSSGTVNRYQFGGQAGAPSGSQPQPYGEWTHHQQRGPDGSFTFHAGTHSAPEGTEIDLIECSDPGWCVQARPAPAKQIDFEGVGTFKNIRNQAAALDHVVPGETLHWFDVHIEDLGEPGRSGHQVNPGKDCPDAGSEGALADCDCPDFYRITIYQGVLPGEPINKTDVIYEVLGYIDGGNLQIHPPIG